MKFHHRACNTQLNEGLCTLDSIKGLQNYIMKSESIFIFKQMMHLKCGCMNDEVLRSVFTLENGINYSDVMHTLFYE